MTATAIPTYDPTLFQGAAPYYVRYRSRFVCICIGSLETLI
ncbi:MULTISPECIES: hypothetical protein [Pseudanabaena]|uniref:Uncharacterized protein n=2 Tax=Pseudanabaena TaxID=1152 RepID=L8N3Q3_9CYAN|nr:MULTISPECIES: hypothetical protein [Pseudanabaena]ELS34286.1 hypothetical protein Pse7429DRAFT_0578 [Pseudanabaena biceps PCC 7429]MDG3493509.1 hypothetical protein [Pseudanabaena catenata USMAC16]